MKNDQNIQQPHQRIVCNIRCHSSAELISRTTSNSHHLCLESFQRGEISGAQQVYSYLASHLNQLQSMPRYIPPHPFTRTHLQLIPAPSSSLSSSSSSSAVSSIFSSLLTIPSSSSALDHIRSSSYEWTRFLSCVSSGIRSVIDKKHQQRMIDEQNLLLQLLNYSVEASSDDHHRGDLESHDRLVDESHS